jgi:peroxiredoxin
MDFMINLQDSTQYINAKNGIVIAVTPEGKEGVEKTLSKTKFASTIVVDNEAQIMKLYDTEHKADPHLVNQLKTKGTDLKKLNGTNETHLPVPAVYVIGKNKKINYIYFNADYTKHPNISDLLEPLEQVLNSGFKKKK